MGLEGGLCAQAHLPAGFGMGQPFEACGLEFRLVADLTGAFRSEQVFDDQFKVFHVWTEHHGLACQRRLHRVLAPLRREAFSDENDRGQFVPMAELSGDIDEEDIERLARIDVTALLGAKLWSCNGVRNFGAAFDVSRDEDQTQRGMLLASDLKDARQDEFLAIMCASSEEDGIGIRYTD